MQMPLVSILVWSDGDDEALSATLQSLLDVAFEPLELLLVSPEPLLEPPVVAALATRRISARGLVGHYDYAQAAQQAQGRYCVRARAGDIYQPAAFAQQVAWLEANADIGIVYAAYLDEAPLRSHEPNAAAKLLRQERLEAVFNGLLDGIVLYEPCVMVRHASLLSITEHEHAVWNAQLLAQLKQQGKRHAYSDVVILMRHAQSDAMHEQQALIEAIIQYASQDQRATQLALAFEGYNSVLRKERLNVSLFESEHPPLGDYASFIETRHLYKSYEEVIRTDLLALIEYTPQRVLEVGCKSGKNLAEIKRRYPHAYTIGVEPDADIAQMAVQVVDQIIPATLDDLNLSSHGILHQSIDMVLIADVLAELYNPWKMLAQLKPYLTSDAQILLSIPNMRNLWFLNQIACGKWAYGRLGMLDINHIRFFDLRDIGRWFAHAGFKVATLDCTVLHGSQEMIVNEESMLAVDAGRFVIKDTTPEERLELSASKFLFRLQPSETMNTASTIPINSLLGKVRDRLNELIEDTPTHLDTRYELWLNNHAPMPIDDIVRSEWQLKWLSEPNFTVLVPVQREQLATLNTTLQSLVAQRYQKWRFLVVADFPAPDPVFINSNILGWFDTSGQGMDVERDVTKVIRLIANKFALDWLVYAPVGSRFDPLYLFDLADSINLFPQWRLIYTDHDYINSVEKRVNPMFKPDINLDLLRSSGYIGDVFAFNYPSMVDCGDVGELPQLWTLDTIFRVIEQYGEAAIGHIAEPYVSLPITHNVPLNDGVLNAVVHMHLVRSGISGYVECGLFPGTMRVVYEHMTQPKVSIIIPNKDSLDYLEPCIEGLFEKTLYKNYEVIVVDNQSKDPDTLQFYRNAAEKYAEKFKVIYYDYPFNFSAQCNLGVREASGEYILLLNNDTEVIQKEWLDRMMNHAQRPEVGVVGVRLVYPESGKIQHAGVGFGLITDKIDAFANHLCIGFDGNLPGYMNRLWLDQSYSMVTAACMMVRKSIYEEVGGMNETELKVLFNDVDLCLKIGKNGWKIIYTPYATAIHYGSVSVGTEQSVEKALNQLVRANTERCYMFDKWHKIMGHDPAYNKNLSLAENNFELECNFIQNWNVHHHERVRILGVPIPGGSGSYRLKYPFRGLVQTGMAHAEYVDFKRFPTLAELSRLKPDTLYLINPFSKQSMTALAWYRDIVPDMLRVASVDDHLAKIPRASSSWYWFRKNMRDAKARLRHGLALCDRVVVSTEPLRELCQDMIGEIHLIPNSISKPLWDLPTQRGVGKKPRVGWVGAQQHGGDLSLLIEVIKATAHEVEWVFMGMVPERVDALIHEAHPFVEFEKYPAAVASLNLDLAVAPLEMNPFNEAKSNLRLLEYGAMRWPVICTDIYPYKENDAPVKRVQNTPEAWINAIRERIYDLDSAYKEGNALRAWVERHYWLEQHLPAWLAALTR